ncbi:carbohydrate ABC transporter permease [Hungatella sp.]|nr:carbohydrate ABC transporter permease [Hungatella sp.]
MKLGRSREDRIINIVTAVLCILVLIVTVYPVYYCLIYSFNDGKDAAKQAIYFWPRKFSLENYKIVFQNKAIYPAFMMTMLRSIVGTVLAVFCMAMAAYALSKDNLKGRKVYMIMGVITLYFSAGVVQSYLLYREMRLLDSFWVYILPNIFQFYYIILFISFFRELPAALEESAQMDGAGYFTILFKIIIPLSTPVIATVSLFVGVWHWNDWFHPAFFIQNESLMTLPAVLMRAMSLAEAQQTLQKMIAVPSQSSTTMESVRYAMLIVSILPVTIIYPFVQKFFLKGMMLGAVKE